MVENLAFSIEEIDIVFVPFGDELHVLVKDGGIIDFLIFLAEAGIPA